LLRITDILLIEHERTVGVVFYCCLWESEREDSQKYSSSKGKGGRKTRGKLEYKYPTSRPEVFLYELSFRGRKREEKAKDHYKEVSRTGFRCLTDEDNREKTYGTPGRYFLGGV